MKWSGGCNSFLSRGHRCHDRVTIVTTAVWSCKMYGFITQIPHGSRNWNSVKFMVSRRLALFHCSQEIQVHEEIKNISVVHSSEFTNYRQLAAGWLLHCSSLQSPKAQKEGDGNHRTRACLFRMPSNRCFDNQSSIQGRYSPWLLHMCGSYPMLWNRK